LTEATNRFEQVHEFISAEDLK